MRVRDGQMDSRGPALKLDDMVKEAIAKYPPRKQ